MAMSQNETAVKVHSNFLTPGHFETDFRVSQYENV